MGEAEKMITVVGGDASVTRDGTNGVKDEDGGKEIH